MHTINLFDAILKNVGRYVSVVHKVITCYVTQLVPCYKMQKKKKGEIKKACPFLKFT